MTTSDHTLPRSPADETGGWIFTDEGHDWLDWYQDRELVGCRVDNRQSQTSSESEGWEFGLFGIKYGCVCQLFDDVTPDVCLSEYSNGYRFRPQDQQKGRVLFL